MDARIIKETLNYYKDSDRAVHLIFNLNNPQRWANGKVLSVSEDRCVILEDKYGEMLIFYDRIADIVPREEKR